MPRIAWNPLKRYPIVSFFVIAFAISWFCWMLGAIQHSGNGLFAWVGNFGPAFSALVLVSANQGKQGLRKLLARLFLWRVGIKGYLIALLAPVALVLIAVPIQVNLGHMPLPTLDPAFWLRVIPSILVIFLVIGSMGLFMCAGEELGWRGYALPLLQDRLGPMFASLLLGFLWGCWHLPLFWIPGTSQNGISIPGFVLACMGDSIIYTCLYNRGKGSVLLASLYHAAYDGFLSSIQGLFPALITQIYLSLIAEVLVVLLVMVLSGGLSLGKSDLKVQKPATV